MGDIGIIILLKTIAVLFQGIGTACHLAATTALKGLTDAGEDFKITDVPGAAGSDHAPNKGTGTGSETGTVPGDSDSALDYASMNRDALIMLCKERGIDVPPRTRTDTLVKQLESWDVAHPGEGVKTPQQSVKTEEQKTLSPDNSNPPEDGNFDPFKNSGSPGSTDPDPDPFADDKPFVPTEEQLRDIVTDYMQEFNAAAACSMLEKIAGTSSFKAVGEEHYPAIYAQCKLDLGRK